MRNIAFLILTVFLFILAPFEAGADISIRLKLDRKEAAIMDSVRAVVSVSGTRKSDSDPVIMGIDDFEITRGGRSSKVEIVNGRVNSGIEYTYYLRAKKEGLFRIGPAELTVDGEKFKSNTEELKIQKPRAGAARGNLFLTATLSSDRAYIYEQLLYILRLHRRVNVSNISLELPESGQFTLKQLEEPEEYQAVINGQTYQVLEIRYSLIPYREGNFDIQPSRMHMTAFEPNRRSNLRSFFDDPFFSAGQAKTVASEPLGLTVISLPDSGRPENFTGLVGNFEIESVMEPTSIKTGESATLTVRLSGQGNVNSIPDLKCPELDYAKIYADQPVLKVGADAKGLKGSKTMKWAVVGEKEGIYQIPSFSISFFDPKSSKYRIIITSPVSFSILPGQKEQVAASIIEEKNEGAKSRAKEEVKEIGSDILPVHTSMDILKRGDSPQTPGMVSWGAVLLPCFIYLGVFAGLRFQKSNERSLAAVKAKKAAGKFVRQYRKNKTVSGDLSLAVRNYLNERFNLTLGSLTPEEAVRILKSNGVKSDTAQKLYVIIEMLENAIYTGEGNAPCDVGEDVPGLISQIEREIR